MSAANGHPAAAENDADDGYTPPPGVQVSSHPVLMHKLSLIRRKSTNSREFRSLFREISFYLGYEATQDLHTKVAHIHTHTAEFCEVRKIADKVAVIPILRGGLGMTDAMLELLPNAPVYHIGMYRNPGSSMPIQYYNRLPKGQSCDVAILLDPIIASAKTICATVSIIKKWGAARVKVVTLIVSRTGLAQLLAVHPDVIVHCAAVDTLADNGHDLVPGIGDAGDRLYLGPDHVDDDELQSPGNKRQRSDAGAGGGGIGKQF
ncbi:uracil phosphoribosyltransferase-domain-containing protein [Tribonema minus]|uniref:uracil phosphoribosyltransferase n=1 Tax=Tribonema minus TaxID=303371 RepID=A0A835YL27_9STRA|nr:uracil phosphoribosyltransferase-domain-containing protein [Tribonema minus]